MCSWTGISGSESQALSDLITRLVNAMLRARRFGVVVGLLLIPVSFLGCAIRTKAKSPKPQTQSLPLLASTEKARAFPEYRLGFGDEIEIKFFRHSQFDETVTVRPDGRISLAKVGELQVTGMTPSRLDSIVTTAYEDFVLEPDVTVIVRQFGGYQVYVLGEVNSPGGYPIQRNMTLLQALAAAGGTKISSKLGSVMILRRGQPPEVEAIKVNLIRSVKAKRPFDISENDLFVQPQDIVFVPKTFVANVSDFMRQVYSGFLPPLDLYLRAVLFYDR